jgi:hypothetical protein
MRDDGSIFAVGDTDLGLSRKLNWSLCIPICVCVWGGGSKRFRRLCDSRVWGFFGEPYYHNFHPSTRIDLDFTSSTLIWYMYGAVFAGAFQMIAAARSLNVDGTSIMQICKIQLCIPVRWTSYTNLVIGAHGLRKSDLTKSLAGQYSCTEPLGWVSSHLQWTWTGS